jgi:hypothetical protein
MGTARKYLNILLLALVLIASLSTDDWRRTVSSQMTTRQDWISKEWFRTLYTHIIASIPYPTRMITVVKKLSGMHKSGFFALRRALNTLLGLEKVNCYFNVVEFFPAWILRVENFNSAAIHLLSGCYPILHKLLYLDHSEKPYVDIRKGPHKMRVSKMQTLALHMPKNSFSMQSLARKEMKQTSLF